MGTSGARLEVVTGNASGTMLTVEDELFLGRHADGPGQLGGDEEISRSHARLSVDATGFFGIEDLGSTNGTFVNGLRISAPQTLSEGDTIEVGATTLVVRQLPTTAVHETPAPTEPETPGPMEPETPAPREQPTVAPGQASTPATTQPPLSLRLEVDFATREARLRLDDASEPVRLVYDAGQWRALTTEKGDQA